MDISKYDVEIKHHVFRQALNRKIDPDIIEKVLLTGKVKRFGKHGIKFISKSTICIGEISGLKIKILTIERRE